MTEQLKKFEEIIEPDTRNTFFVITNIDTGKSRQMELEDIYKSVSSIELSANVPDEIRSQFNVARNLALYTWFSYSFHQPSELKAFSTVEFALRKIYSSKRQGLKILVIRAIEDGYIKDSGFSHIDSRGEMEPTINYAMKLKDLIPSFRNNLAHGRKLSFRNCINIHNDMISKRGRHVINRCLWFSNLRIGNIKVKRQSTPTAADQ